MQRVSDLLWLLRACVAGPVMILSLCVLIAVVILFRTARLSGLANAMETFTDWIDVRFERFIDWA